MNVIIPMAGRGKRFEDVGYSIPKPLIMINGIPMIQLVVNNLGIKGNYIFVCRKEHYQKFLLQKLLTNVKPGCKIILLDHITNGAAETALHAKEDINNDEELIIADSDGWVSWNYDDFLNFLKNKNPDGGIVTFKSTEDKWSFAKIDRSGVVVKVAEKIPISNNAIAGIYYFKKGKYFVEAAENMIKKNIKTKNEFYIAPVYNQIISSGKKIMAYPVDNMIGLGTPKDLQKFLNHFNDL